MSEYAAQIKSAPAGFTPTQLREFLEQGYVVIEDVISSSDIVRYREAVYRVAAATRSLTGRDQRIYSPSLRAPGDVAGTAQFLHIEGVVARDPCLEELIDHPRHIGYVYDLFGQMIRLHISEIFIRPNDSGRNPWHVDGPRMLPFSALAGPLPVQVRVGYWLTDLPEESMGNLVVLPGSHRTPYFAAADTDDDVPGQVAVKIKRGSMTIMNGSMWHRVDTNTSSVTRKNIYIGYCPSWVTPGEQTTRDEVWVKKLPRERRIILRHYEHPYDYSKPPAEDTPLYLDRPSDPYPCTFAYPEHLSFHRRKQATVLERYLAAIGGRILPEDPQKSQEELRPC